MNKFNLIIIFIVFGIVYTRQTGSLTNHIFTFQPSTNSSSIKILQFQYLSSCNTCICAAFMLTIEYVAINCYKNNNTCLLFPSWNNITGITPSSNNSLYILSDILIPSDITYNSMNQGGLIGPTFTSTHSVLSLSSTTATSKSPSTTTIRTSTDGGTTPTTTTPCIFGPFNPFCWM